MGGKARAARGVAQGLGPSSPPPTKKTSGSLSPVVSHRAADSHDQRGHAVDPPDAVRLVRHLVEVLVALHCEVRRHHGQAPGCRRGRAWRPASSACQFLGRRGVATACPGRIRRPGRPRRSARRRAAWHSRIVGDASESRNARLSSRMAAPISAWSMTLPGGRLDPALVDPAPIRHAVAVGALFDGVGRHPEAAGDPHDAHRRRRREQFDKRRDVDLRREVEAAPAAPPIATCRGRNGRGYSSPTAAMSMSRWPIAVRTLRRSRLNAASALGLTSRPSRLAFQVVELDRDAEIGVGLRPGHRIVPAVVLVDGGDEREHAVVLEDAFEHLDRVVVLRGRRRSPGSSSPAVVMIHSSGCRRAPSAVSSTSSSARVRCLCSSSISTHVRVEPVERPIVRLIAARTSRPSRRPTC